jgi:hypothetical protein
MLILAVADAPWSRKIRVCEGPEVLHAVLLQQHGAFGGVGALLGNGAAFSPSDSRLVVEGYPIPRAPMDASLHPPCLRDMSWGSATSAAKRADIGKDVLLQYVDSHVLSHLLL